MEEKAELKISGVEVIERRRGIPLSGRESVRDALELLHSATAPYIERTGEENLNIDAGVIRADFEASAAKAVARVRLNPSGIYHLVLERSGQDPFVDSLVEEAIDTIREHGMYWTTNSNNTYYRVASHIAHGLVFGSFLTIREIQGQHNAYLLEINSPTTEGAEHHLAESLGIERDLRWKAVMVGLEPDSDNFAIDFDQVLKRVVSPLAGLYGQEAENRVTGHSAARTLYEIAMNVTDNHDSGPSSILLGERNGLAVRVSLEGIGSPVAYGYRIGDPIFWTVEGAILRGPLVRDFLDQRRFSIPTIVFKIDRRGREWYKTPKTIIDSPTKAAINSLADTIASAFR